MQQAHEQNGLGNTLHDAGVYLRASAAHHNPTNPTVQKLAKSQRREGISLLKSVLRVPVSRQQIALKLGPNAVRAIGVDGQAEGEPLTLKPGEELVIGSTAVSPINQRKTGFNATTEAGMVFLPSTVVADAVIGGGELSLVTAGRTVIAEELTPQAA